MKSAIPPPVFLNGIGIAALTFITACFFHEVLGHGGACLLGGGQITLLTSVYFHCDIGSVITDLGGPFANLLLGLAAYALLEWRNWSANLRQILVLTIAFNFFWFAGCILESAVVDKSDFAYFLHTLNITPSWLGNLTLGIVGLLVYWFSMKIISKHAYQRSSLVISYVVAGLVSCGAALFFMGSVVPALREAALESFGSAAGLLLIARKKSHDLPYSSLYISSTNSYGWLGAGILAIIIFVIFLGRGLVVTSNI
jgi:hypothetical protein